MTLNCGFSWKAGRSGKPRPSFFHGHNWLGWEAALRFSWAVLQSRAPSFLPHSCHLAHLMMKQISRGYGWPQSDRVCPGLEIRFVSSVGEGIFNHAWGSVLSGQLFKKYINASFRSPSVFFWEVLPSLFILLWLMIRYIRKGSPTHLYLFSIYLLGFFAGKPQKLTFVNLIKNHLLEGGWVVDRIREKAEQAVSGNQGSHENLSQKLVSQLVWGLAVRCFSSVSLHRTFSFPEESPWSQLRLVPTTLSNGVVGPLDALGTKRKNWILLVKKEKKMLGKCK